MKKGVSENFAKFAGIYLCQGLFSIKFQVKTCNFIRKKSGTGIFLWILRDFSEQLFHRIYPDDDFCILFQYLMPWNYRHSYYSSMLIISKIWWKFQFNGLSRTEVMKLIKFYHFANCRHPVDNKSCKCEDLKMRFRVHTSNSLCL